MMMVLNAKGAMSAQIVMRFFKRILKKNSPRYINMVRGFSFTIDNELIMHYTILTEKWSSLTKENK